MNCAAEIYQTIKLKKLYHIMLVLMSLVALGLFIAVYLSDKGVY